MTCVSLKDMPDCKWSCVNSGKTRHINGFVALDRIKRRSAGWWRGPDSINSLL